MIKQGIVIIRNRQMSKIRLLFLYLAIISFFPVFGQKEKNIIYRVGIGELTYTPPKSEEPSGNVLKILKNVAESLLNDQNSKEQPQYAGAVRASIVNGLSKVCLFRPSDGPLSQAELSDTPPAFSADGTIASISTVSKTDTKTDSKGKKYSETSYTGIIVVTVNLKDPYDGTLVNSQTFSIGDGELNWAPSVEKAVSNALESLTKNVSGYYNHLYPLHASIVEKGEIKKNKQKDVYIDLGAADGVYKGQQFDVFLVNIIAGKEAPTNIGRLKIEEVEGNDISLCKVTKGADKIKAALDDGQTLLVTSR